MWGIYTLPKSGQVNFLWGNNGSRTAIEHLYLPKNFYTSPKQISGYAPARSIGLPQSTTLIDPESTFNGHYSALLYYTHVFRQGSRALVLVKYLGEGPSID